jgi:hypothetical protein
MELPVEIDLATDLMQRFTESLFKIRLEGARTTKRYFKHWAESDLGSGIASIEFDGELPTRQVEKYGDRWFSSIKRSHPEIGPGLIEATLSESGLEPQHEIAQAEFEEVWNEALKHVQ